MDLTDHVNHLAAGHRGGHKVFRGVDSSEAPGPKLKVETCQCVMGFVYRKMSRKVGLAMVYAGFLAFSSSKPSG